MRAMQFFKDLSLSAFVAGFVAVLVGFTSYQKEAPRLCRGGSRSLTFQEVVHRRDFQS